MTDDETAVRAALDRWFDALNAMVAGDPEPFAAVFSHADDTIYMSGEGTVRSGWAATFADWKNQAKRSRGGHVTHEEPRIWMAGEMAAAAVVAHASIAGPDGAPRELRFRHTNLFRREDGAWKLIVHHADDNPVWAAVVGAE